MVSDKAVACPKCGSPVSDMIVASKGSGQKVTNKPSADDSLPHTGQHSATSGEKGERGNNLTYVLLGAAALLCVASIAFFFIRKGNTELEEKEVASIANNVEHINSTQSDVKQVEYYSPMGRRRYTCPLTIGSQKLTLILDLDFDNLTGTTNWGNGPLPLKFTMNVSRQDVCPIKIIEYNPDMSTIKNSVFEGNITSEIDCIVYRDGTIKGKGRSWNGLKYSFEGMDE